MEGPKKIILTKEGVLTRTPGMINKEELEAEIAEATRKEAAGGSLGTESGLIKREQAKESPVDIGESGTTSGLIRREQAKEKDAVRVGELKDKLEKTFLVNRNSGKKLE